MAEQTEQKSYSMNYDILLKILVIGNSAVGKSSLLLRYVDDTFKESLSTTIGVDFKWKTETVNNKVVKLQIWDTAGQERFRTITSALYNGAHGALLVYDVTNEESFSGIEYWVGEVKKRAAENISILLVGNKADLEAQRAVSNEKGRDLATKLGIEFFETSAKTKQNVDMAFSHIVKKCLQGRVGGNEGHTSTTTGGSGGSVVAPPSQGGTIIIQPAQQTGGSHDTPAPAKKPCCG